MEKQEFDFTIPEPHPNGCTFEFLTGQKPFTSPPPPAASEEEEEEETEEEKQFSSDDDSYDSLDDEWKEFFEEGTEHRSAFAKEYFSDDCESSSEDEASEGRKKISPHHMWVIRSFRR